jgi:phthalate 4,5-dioxygenase
MHIRTYHFILPFHQIRPSRSESGVQLVAGHCWVPMDDETTMVYNWAYSPTEALTGIDRQERGLGNGPVHVDPNTFRSHANRANNYLMDRAVQRNENYTGIDGINVQDRAIQESMGRIVDRSKEHLGPADKAIIQARKLLRQAVKTVAAGGTPDGTGTSYYSLFAHEAVLPSGADWRSQVTPEMRAEMILQTV